ncbi:MAG: hypothetical protein U0359_25275 [Byssovorax sp.]
MPRAPLLGLALLAPLALVACNRGPTNKDLFTQNQALATTLKQGLDAAAKSVETAPSPEVGAPCEAKGLTMDQEAGFDAEKNKQGAGNTEVVEYRGLHGDWKLLGGAPGDNEAWKLDDPAGYQLRLTTFKANVPSAVYQLSPGGSLHQGGTAPGDRAAPQLVTQIERAKGVSHLIVIRGRKKAPDGRSQIVDIHHVEFPSGKWLCAFAVESKVDPKVQEGEILRVQRSGGMENRSTRGDDAVGNALRAGVMAEINKALKTRFDLPGLQASL